MRGFGDNLVNEEMPASSLGAAAGREEEGLREREDRCSHQETKQAAGNGQEMFTLLSYLPGS